MQTNSIEKDFIQLFENWAGEKASLVLPLAPSGSSRVYYRLKGSEKSAIATYNLNRKENEAFLYFSRNFKEKGLNVPEIYAEDLDRNIYLQEDLGATTLYSFLLQKGDGFPDKLVKMYKGVVQNLAELQVRGGVGLDYGQCFPIASFDKQSMLWDLNHFKYYFVQLANIVFDEQALEKDFHRFADYLLQADCNHFLYRDFQSRNIMMKSGSPYFIDYQGGRKGALQYDLASLLYQAKANIPHDIKLELLDGYLEALEALIPVDRTAFTQYFYGYVLIRCIQTLGTYGLRGLHERKAHFLSSIPFAINNVKWILANVKFDVEIPTLWKVLEDITETKAFEPFDKETGEKSLLTVKVNSFSYKKEIPQDDSGNGGGFTFDCRFLHNPGRYEPYKKLTGRDEPVINFLKQHSTIDNYLNSVFGIVDEAVENYIERSFTSLMVSFGCTGGQHRSVYAADQLAAHLKNKYGVKVVLKHLVQGF